MFFFFKQKTAYEMRISDWSSDVCSSDLEQVDQQGDELEELARRRRVQQQRGVLRFRRHAPARAGAGPVGRQAGRQRARFPVGRIGERDVRSEEHTSELQSLMRISYAVFCLKKKKQ